jgi:hypothetical protein
MISKKKSVFVVCKTDAFVKKLHLSIVILKYRNYAVFLLKNCLQTICDVEQFEMMKKFQTLFIRVWCQLSRIN